MSRVQGLERRERPECISWGGRPSLERLSSFSRAELEAWDLMPRALLPRNICQQALPALCWS